MDVAQLTTAILAHYLKEMDVDPALLSLMALTPKEGMTVLNQRQLSDLRVANNGRLPSTWSIQALPEGLYLRGEQQTYTGHGKAIFFCDSTRGLVVFNSHTPIAADQAPTMTSGEWEHSLLVNGEHLPLTRTKGTFNGTYLNTAFLLTSDQAARIGVAKSIGHALQTARTAALFVGYTIDVDREQQKSVSNFLASCTRLKR